MNITEQIRDFVVSNYLFGNAGTLDNNTSFMRDGIIDSTGILELIAFLERTYDIKIQDQEMLPENFDSVNRIAQYLARKTGTSSAPVASA